MYLFDVSPNLIPSQIHLFDRLFIKLFPHSHYRNHLEVDHITAEEAFITETESQYGRHCILDQLEIDYIYDGIGSISRNPKVLEADQANGRGKL